MTGRRRGGVEAGRVEANAISRRYMRQFYASCTESELVAGLLGIEPAAIRAFIERYQPKLSARARRFGIAEPARSELVSDILHDSVCRLTQRRTPLRAPLAAYLALALRNRLRNRARDGSAHARRVAEASGLGGSAALSAASDVVRPDVAYSDAEHAMVDSVLSEGTRHASEGAWWEPSTLTPALERLASALEEGLTSDERRMLIWVAHFVPLREVAEGLGITRTAAKVRLFRLRARLKEAAVHFASALEPNERSELLKFFRRTASMSATDLERVRDGPRGELPRAAHEATAGRPENEGATSIPTDVDSRRSES